MWGGGDFGQTSSVFSTIAFEKRFNTALRADKVTFIAAMLADLPPQPEGMAEIIRRNNH